jgi:hypothetical protein
MTGKERAALSEALYAWRNEVFYYLSGNGTYADKITNEGPLSFEAVLLRHKEARS